MINERFLLSTKLARLKTIHLAKHLAQRSGDQLLQSGRIKHAGRGHARSCFIKSAIFQRKLCVVHIDGWADLFGVEIHAVTDVIKIDGAAERCNLVQICAKIDHRPARGKIVVHVNSHAIKADIIDAHHANHGARVAWQTIKIKHCAFKCNVDDIALLAIKRLPAHDQPVGCNCTSVPLDIGQKRAHIDANKRDTVAHNVYIDLFIAHICQYTQGRNKALHDHRQNIVE